MEDIWNRVMEDPATVRFVQADSFSPYCESVVGSIRHDGSLDVVELNGFYRYGDILHALFAMEGREDGVCQLMFDCLMHLLARLEVRNGVTFSEFRLRRKWDMLAEGQYGEPVRSCFGKMDAPGKYLTAHYLSRQEQMGESVALFAKALIAILGDGIIYKNDRNPKELLLYMGREQGTRDKLAIELCCELFLPFMYSLRVFYEASFGIVDEKDCMELGSIEIF